MLLSQENVCSGHRTALERTDRKGFVTSSRLDVSHLYHQACHADMVTLYNERGMGHCQVS